MKNKKNRRLDSRDAKTINPLYTVFLFTVAFCQRDWFTFLMRIKYRPIAVQFENKISCSWSCMLALFWIVYEAYVLLLEVLKANLVGYMIVTLSLFCLTISGTHRHWTAKQQICWEVVR